MRQIDTNQGVAMTRATMILIQIDKETGITLFQNHGEIVMYRGDTIVAVAESMTEAEDILAYERDQAWSTSSHAYDPMTGKTVTL